jgi:peptide/nickel transport system permease protein
MLKVAIPNKGILSETAIVMLREAGYAVRRDSRELHVIDVENNIEFFYLRPRDIATYVGSGSLDVGLTGLDRAADIGRHLVLPVLSLGLVYMALYLRLMRDGMAELWAQDFIRAARARGMHGARLVLRHVARNALLPVVTMLGLQSAAMLGGSVVIESVFAIPGLGRLASEAVARRDTPLLLGVMLLSAMVVMLVNLLVDLAYAMLDPRVGSGTGG